MIKLRFEFSEYGLDIPINPENLEISSSNNNETFNIVGLGDIVVPGQVGLKTFDIESFFPAYNNPKGCVKFFQDLINTQKPARFITQGMTIDLDLLVLINDFSYDTRAGEEEDIYYSMSLTEYKSYGAKLIDIKDELNNEILPQTPEREDTKPTVAQTYIVQSGDSLWSITKRFSGDGNNWGSLYVANKSVIGNNPNLIKPGQVLTLPTEWKYVAVSTGSSKKVSTNKNAGTNNSITSTHTSSSGRTHGGGGKSFDTGSVLNTNKPKLPTTGYSSPLDMKQRIEANSKPVYITSVKYPGSGGRGETLSNQIGSYKQTGNWYYKQGMIDLGGSY